MAAPHALAGHRHVDPLLRQPAIELRSFQLGLAGVDRRLDPLAERVERHPGLAVANVAERELQLALAPEILDADTFDLVRRGRGCNRLERRALECLVIHASAEVTNAPDPS